MGWCYPWGSGLGLYEKANSERDEQSFFSMISASVLPSSSYPVFLDDELKPVSPKHSFFSLKKEREIYTNNYYFNTHLS